ncbi:MAG: endonuclease/exonuclease/phosphatase family protein [Prevotellaceae bacterium]|jgi:endonuclease/exonuclease/phosphatase family metal-dependent hydrolase|nr:endonuclease/exonuclease/phosphatase family protein [Prevotellaceae bacterium]
MRKSNDPLFRLLYWISIGLTVFLAVITIVAAFAVRVSPTDSQWIPLLGFGLPILLFANVAACIYWLIRWRCYLWISLLAVVCNYSYIAAMYQYPWHRGELAHNEKTLKLMTFNVGRFAKDNSGMAQRKLPFFMYENRVDILCMQEFAEIGNYNADSLKTLFAQWPYVAIPKPEDKTPILPLAVFSRYPILNYELITYPETPNCSMWFDVDFNGTTIRIFSNHLQTTNVNQSRRQYEKYYQSANSLDANLSFAEGTLALWHSNDIRRAAQANMIHDLVLKSPHPVIVCGDLNSTPSSYVYGRMKGDLKDGFKTAGHGYAGTYRYAKGLMRIDYIFHSPALRPVDYYSTDMDLNSDHNPVLMELDVR